MRVRPFLVSSVLSLLALSVAPVGAAASVAPDRIYTALRTARPDGRRIPVSGLVLQRDVFRFQLDSGALHLLAPVDGRTVGAVFVGKGSYRLNPANETERRHLALVAGGGEKFEVLTDSFEEMVLLFTDKTLAEIEGHAPAAVGPAEPRVQAAWDRQMKRQRKDFHDNFHLRVLCDLLDSPAADGTPLGGGVFMAFVDGKELPPALAAVDPRGVEALGVGSLMGGEESMFMVDDDRRGGIWYLADRGGAAATSATSRPDRYPVDALDYSVSTRVQRDADLEGTTRIRFLVRQGGLRVLPLNLMPRLRLSSASFAPVKAGEPAAWTDIPFVQEAKEEDGDSALVFPRPLAAGETIELKLAYAGDQVLHDAGEHNYVVGARESWYPNLATFSDPATFELTYRVPKGNDVVSVGQLLESHVDGDETVSTWLCDQPVRVAGFNYGRFKKLERKEPQTGVDVAVYTSTGTPDAINDINAFLRSQSQASTGDDFGDDEDGGGGAPGAEVSLLNTDKLAESALVDGLNAARVFTTFFGPLPVARVAITQQSEWSYGQSWPQLIFLPYMSFLSGSQRAQIGLNQAASFLNEVGYHEFSHQWWGHLVGWSSYRDQWLSEGFAEFSAALALQQVRGWPAYGKFWKADRKAILEKSPGDSVPPYQAGPISLGWRLATQKSPSAGQMIYSKGGYVLHMLRMLMWDSTTPNPDAKFIAMMKDFVTTNAGKHPSTADFQKAVERHMSPTMDATHDGKMDWFFRQWVYGTEIPRYTAKLKVDKAGDSYKITGQVTQEGVAPEFYAYVPVYLDFGKGETGRLGGVGIAGSSTVPVDVTVKLPKKPKRVLINAAGDVLARD